MSEPRGLWTNGGVRDSHGHRGGSHRAHQAGYRKMDAYSPFPVKGLSEAIGFHKDAVALVCLIGGLLGLLTAYVLQYWINVIAYPLERCRQAVSLVAVVHHRDLRADDSFRWTISRSRHAGAEWVADAVSPGFQRA